MSAGEKVDVLAVLDAFAATDQQVCCGFPVGGGMDENGNGEPPSCCCNPVTSDGLRLARAAVAELIEAVRAQQDFQRRWDDPQSSATAREGIEVQVPLQQFCDTVTFIRRRTSDYSSMPDKAWEKFVLDALVREAGYVATRAFNAGRRLEAGLAKSPLGDGIEVKP